MKTKDFSLRIEDDLLKKLHFVAAYEDRSVNGELLRMVKCRIREFEKEHGAIEITPDEKIGM